MALEIDESEWPIVKLRWSGTVSDGEALTLLSRLDEYLARGRRFGLLIDARGGGGLSPEQRNRLLSHMKENAELTSRLLVQAAVLDNPVQRTLFYGVHLLFPRPYPSKVFEEPVAATKWLAAQLASGAAHQ